jgi:hypothetical protein
LACEFHITADGDLIKSSGLTPPRRAQSLARGKIADGPCDLHRRAWRTRAPGAVPNKPGDDILAQMTGPPGYKTSGI